MERIARRIAVVAIATIAFTASANAVVAFNNFGAGDTFDTGTGFTASGPSSTPGANRSACQFTSAASGSLVSLTIAASLALGTNSAMASIYNDSGSDTLGSWITTWTFGGLPAFGGAYSPTVLINAFPSITLAAGAKYWVELAPGAADTWAVWNWNSTGHSGPRAWSTDSGTSYVYDTQRSGAMRLDVVPEPATATALALGVVALLRRRRK